MRAQGRLRLLDVIARVCWRLPAFALTLREPLANCALALLLILTSRCVPC